ncbi:MAG: hypothetical protein AAB664_02290 [Patescibacteria group bacterium]
MLHFRNEELDIDFRLEIIMSTFYSDNKKGLVTRLNEQLAGDDGHEWLVALYRFLQKQDPWSVTIQPINASFTGCRFPVWKTITLGLRRAGTYQKELTKEGFTLCEFTGAVLRKIKYSKVRLEVQLACVMIKDLGLTFGGTWGEILALIRLNDGEICPAEVGPALRLVYTEQSRKEHCLIAMKAIPNVYRGSEVFLLENSYRPHCLDMEIGEPSHYFPPHFSVVFMISDNKQKSHPSYP